MTVTEAIDLSEKELMPEAFMAQQVSFSNEAKWMFADGPEPRARDARGASGLRVKKLLQSANLF